MDHPIPVAQLPDSIRKFCDPSGPPPGRMMAAKGLVPLKPPELVTVLYQLSYDPDEQVKAAAVQKYESLPENIVAGAMAAALDERVLDFYADRFKRKPIFLEPILLNHATADETVARCAKWANEQLSELIATNEQRLLRHPVIIENLYHNQHARMSTVNRAIELAVRNDIVLHGIAAFKEAVAAIQGELIPDELGEQPGDQAFVDTLALGDELDREDGSEGIEEQLANERPESEKKKSLQQQLNDMTNAEKVRTALIGAAVFRPFLIRDRNPIVAMAAIKSPGVKETEVMAYARNKTLADDVIRYIANKKEWTKGYAVKRALIENPKTPLPSALSFMSHLRAHDLRQIARSKNVPAAVAAAARNQMMKRQ